MNQRQEGRRSVAAKDAREILFVDPAVESAPALLNGLRSGVDCVRLPEGDDPIAAMALHLAGRRGVEVIHVLSHGVPGALVMSGRRIDASALAARPTLTAAIRDALSEDAEIVLYGCSVAQGREGAAFVGALSSLLERPVAAATGPVGAAPLGGGWDIPARHALAFDAAARAAYTATLAVATFGVVTTINTVNTLTTTESGVTIDVVRSDGTPMAGVSSGFLDTGVIANTVTYTLTFGSAVNITQFQIGEFANNTANGNYVFTPNTGSAITLADDSGSISGAIATLTAGDWNGVTSFTVSFTGTNTWRVGIDNIRFTSAVTTAASTNAGGFNTTDGTNLTPGLTFVGNDETLTITDASHITGTSVANGGAGTDTIVLATGSDLSTAGFTLSNFETVTLAANASVTMTEAQHDAFTTINGNTGAEQITLASANGDGNVTGDADIETYVLGVTGFNFTLGAATQNVTGSSGADTVTVGTLTPTGTLNGAGGTDTLSLGNGANIAGATVSNFENLTLATGSTTTIAASQLSQFSGTVTAAGTETVTVSGDGAFTTLANVETYSVGDDSTNARTITVGQAGTNVTATTANDANTFNLGTLTYTGTVTGEGTTDDILSLASGANIAGGTITAVEALTLASGASVIMTTAQLEAFTGTVTAAGSETVTLTTTGTVTNAGLSAIETVATAADTSTQTITLTAAQAAGKTLTAGDAGQDGFSVTGSAGGQTVTGSAGADTIAGGDDDDTLSGGGGNDVVSGGDGLDVLAGGAGNDTFTGSAAEFNGDTISDFGVGDSIIVTGADLSALHGTTAAGTVAISGNDPTTLTGITTASGTYSAIFAGGNTTITLVAPVVVVDNGGGGDGGGGGGGGGGDSGTIIVTPTTPSITSTNTSQSISNTGSSSGSAAIVQNSGNNTNVVTATLPASVSLTSEGPSVAPSGTLASTTLITAIQARSTSGEAGLVSNAETFLNRLGATTALDIRTIIPTQSTGVTSGDPIIITGTAGSGQSEALVIDMRSITGKTLQLDNIEFASIIGTATVNGGAGNNYAMGDDANQFISLGVGDDTLFGGGGNDVIGSGAGVDYLYGESGNDTIAGGTDSDVLFGGLDQDVLYGNQAADVIYGNQGFDTLFGGQDNDTLFGGQHEDVAYGNLGADAVYGNLGQDTLYGGQGNDTLYGGKGNDTLFGGEGDDTLLGGAGNDLLIGGNGADLVVIQDGGGADTISGFTGAAGDRVQISANLNGTSIDTFAELQAVTANDADGNAVITLGSGHTVTLMGVNTSELQSGWFSFG